MAVTPRMRTLVLPTFATTLLLIGCSADKKSAAAPKPGTLAHSWFTANEAWKAGDYDKAVQHLARLAVTQSEYRERARQWVIVAAGGVADGYRELADAYEAGSLASRQLNLEYRRKMIQTRDAANNAAMLYAETIHDFLNKEKDLRLKLDVDFPTGSAAEPSQLARISKGLPVQAADHEAAKTAMARRGVVRFATALAAADGNIETAKQQFAAPPREVALAAVASHLLGLSDMYRNKKMDMPKRGNALCKEAEQTIALIPGGSKEKKVLETKLKEELKRFVVKT